MRFVWHDLKTLDAERARAFYAELLGWSLRPMAPGITLIDCGGNIGTIMQEPGIPSAHWMPYLGVSDLDDASRQVVAMGGKHCLGPYDIPKLGHFSVMSDPEGVYFSLLQGTKTPATGPGQVVWNELATRDPEGAARFYGELCGWRVEQVNFDYRVARDDDGDAAGIMTIPASVPAPPHWFPYFATGDVDAATTKAQSLGARLFYGPVDVNHFGRSAMLGDPTGARFALFQKT